MQSSTAVWQGSVLMAVARVLTLRVVGSDHVEKLVVQVLEETRAFRREVLDELRTVKGDLALVKGDLALVKLAVTEHSREIKDLRGDMRRIEVKLDTAVAEHGARIDKLEGAAE